MFSHVQEIYSEEKNTFFFFLRTALVRRCILYCEKSLSVLGAQFSDQVNDGRREEEDGQRRRGGESGGGVAQVSFAGSAEGHLVPRNFGHRLTRVGFGVFRHGARTNRRHLAAVLVDFVDLDASDRDGHMGEGALQVSHAKHTADAR